MLTIYDFMEMFVDKSDIFVRIYDISVDADVIFEGYGNDIPENLENYEISSLDNPDGTGIVGINVDVAEMED